MSSKKKTLDFVERKEVLKHHREQHLSSRELAIKFNCGKGQIQAIIKKKDVIEASSFGPERKRINCHLKHKELDDLVFDWFLKARALNIPITGPLIQEKAL